MASVKNKNTSTEILIRKELFRKGYRYRINCKKLPGSPDIVLPKFHSIIFVHGCFWHGHENCKYAIMPTTNIEFWRNKIKKNTVRDKKNIKLLKEMGWKVIIIWQCEINTKQKLLKKVRTVIELISSNPIKPTKKLINLESFTDIQSTA